MPLNARQLIAGLGDGQDLAEIARAAGVTSAETENLWNEIIRSRVPATSDRLVGGVAASVEVIRDSYGVPHVYAQHERDVFFGLGLAMAQDRLWQMDYMRRKA